MVNNVADSPGTLSESRIIDLPQFTDERGSLSFAEQHEHIPFDIKRFYYLYDVPGDKTRGDHGHRELRQVMIAVNGSFEVHLNDGYERTTMLLDDPSEGLYIPRLVWRSVEGFSEGAVALNITAQYYDEDDYIHDYDEFTELARSNQ